MSDPTKKTVTVKRSVRMGAPAVQIPTANFGPIFDQVMTGTRLALALHRIEAAKEENGISTPSELIAWEIFLALASAVEELGFAAGYEADACVPE